MNSFYARVELHRGSLVTPGSENPVDELAVGLLAQVGVRQACALGVLLSQHREVADVPVGVGSDQRVHQSLLHVQVLRIDRFLPDKRLALLFNPFVLTGKSIFFVELSLHGPLWLVGFLH